MFKVWLNVGKGRLPIEKIAPRKSSLLWQSCIMELMGWLMCIWPPSVIGDNSG